MVILVVFGDFLDFGNGGGGVEGGGGLEDDLDLILQGVPYGCCSIFTFCIWIISSSNLGFVGT